jgi:hypothetical protein
LLPLKVSSRNGHQLLDLFPIRADPFGEPLRYLIQLVDVHGALSCSSSDTQVLARLEIKITPIADQLQPAIDVDGLDGDLIAEAIKHLQRHLVAIFNAVVGRRRQHLDRRLAGSIEQYN